MDVDLPPINNMLVVPEQQKKPDYDTEIDHGPKVFDGVNDYILVCDIENHSTKPPERHGYDHLAANALLTS